jgi:hypothetical protein
LGLHSGFSLVATGSVGAHNIEHPTKTAPAFPALVFFSGRSYSRGVEKTALGVPLEKISKLAAETDESSFCTVYRFPALVVTSEGIDSKDAPIDTMAIPLKVKTERAIRPGFEGETTEHGGAPLRKPLGPPAVVFLEKSERNPFGDMITLGRTPNNDVVLPLGTVSKLHLIFRRTGQSWAVSDQDSTNGTVVDGQPVKAHETVALGEGSVIRVGPEVRARFFTPAGLFAHLKNRVSSRFRAVIATTVGAMKIASGSSA